MLLFGCFTLLARIVFIFQQHSYRSFRLALAWLSVLAVCLLLSVRLHSQVNVNFLQLKKALQAQFSSAAALKRIESWQALLQQLQTKSEREQVMQINKFLHRHLNYQTDDVLYAKSDYWASPVELFGHGLGDCEDWAIAAYVSLRSLGVSEEKLRLIYVKARIGGPNSGITQAHMVLGYYPQSNAQPLIIDSLLTDVLPASQRDDLSPVFSFNSAGLWAGHGNQQAKSSPTARMSPWREVLERMRLEGIRFE